MKLIAIALILIAFGPLYVLLIGIVWTIETGRWLRARASRRRDSTAPAPR